MKLSRTRMAFMSAAAMSLTSGTAVAQEVQATFGSIFSAGVPIVQCGAIPLAEDEALKESGFNVSVIHSAQLGSENQLAEQVSFGELEMATITSSLLAAWLEDLAVLETYYLYENTDQVMEVYETPTAEKLFAELLDVANIRVIGQPWLYGERHMFGNKELNSPDDFKGLRMRVPESFVSIEGAKSLGANPTPVAYSELYIALQQGVADAAEAPLSVIEAESFDEVSEYLVLTRHLITAQPFIVNEDFWQSLTDEQRTALESAAQAGSERVRVCAEKADQAAVEKWEAEDRLKIIDIDRQPIRENAQAYFSDGFSFSETYKQLLHDLKNDE